VLGLSIAFAASSFFLSFFSFGAAWYLMDEPVAGFVVPFTARSPSRF